MKNEFLEQLEKIKTITLKNNTKNNTKNKNQNPNQNPNQTNQYETSYTRKLDGYQRPNITKQDEISSDPEQVKARFVDFTRIDKEEYKFIKPGTYIRYMKALPNGKYQYCVGGYLQLNKFPDYWKLTNTIYGNRNRTWSVQLKSDNIYYKRNVEEQLPEQMVNEMYKNIKTGKYRLIKTTDLEQLLKSVSENEKRNLSMTTHFNKNESDGEEENNENEKNSSTEGSDTEGEEEENEGENESENEIKKRPSTYVELVK